MHQTFHLYGLIALVMLNLGMKATAQQAQVLNAEAARAALSAKPPRNPVKSSAPILKRTYERQASKGLGLETGTAETVEVEVIHRADGSTEEHLFVSLPLLFEVNSDTLLDTTSRANANQMAAILSEVARDPKARFTIQGHTSAEGDAAANQTLSDQRAARIHTLLVSQGVPAAALNTQGLGETCAQFAETAAESQCQLDRRVLIVRLK